MATAKAKKTPAQIKKKAAEEEEESEFSTSWDIDNYRTEYESEEHWSLRKKFMQVHKDKFPEEKLVCLAQVFTNMEFLGCKYPAETMRLVGELSQEVAKKFREERSGRLKRTFVSAKDAAENRVKGRMAQQKQQQQQGTTSHHQLGTKRTAFDCGEDTGQFSKKPKVTPFNEEMLYKDLKYGKLVLTLIGGRNCIRLSAQNCNLEMKEINKELADGKKQTEIFVGHHLVGIGAETSLKLAKEAAFNNAMETLRKECYCVKPNPSQSFIKVDKVDDKIVCDVQQEGKIAETNKGFNMLKKMGWTGGGLGANKQGREDIVEQLFKINRSGLGAQKCLLDKKFYRNMLQNYAQSDEIRELRFVKAFSKDERAWLHELSLQFSLKSKSRGTEDNRSLYIFKKNPSNPEIVKEILINHNEKFCDKFLLQVPEKKAHLFPDYAKQLELDE